MRESMLILPVGGGSIWVRVFLSDKQTLLASVRNEGVGLPGDFDPTTSKRLGTRLVTALSQQLGADLTRPTSPIGTNFTLVVQLEPPMAS